VTGAGKARDFETARDHAIIRILRSEGIRRSELLGMRCQMRILFGESSRVLANARRQSALKARSKIIQPCWMSCKRRGRRDCWPGSVFICCEVILEGGVPELIDRAGPSQDAHPVSVIKERAEPEGKLPAAG
jgi:hypothetical protein